MMMARTQSKAWRSMVAAGLVGMGALSSNAQTAGFWLVGWPPGGTASGVRALSQDGHVAGGASFIPGQVKSAAFRWTASTGRDDWGLLPGMPYYTPVQASDGSGQIVAGYMTVEGLPGERPYRRVGDGPLENLGTLPGQTRCYAWGMSGDGSVVVGHAENGTWTDAYGEAFRWTLAAGMMGLGYLYPNGTLSKAYGVSRDGKTIVGTSQSFGPGGPQGAFVWTEAAGMVVLPWLPTAPFASESARAVNADGTVVVGKSPSAGGWSHAVRWTPTGIEDLVSPTYSAVHGIAYAVCDDGSIVGGTVFPSGNDLAFVWTPELGMLNAADYLASHGVTVPVDYTLRSIRAISGDGLTIAGDARSFLTSQIVGFVATIPGKLCIPDCDASSALDIDDFICFQTRFAIDDPYADCDSSGALDIDDFICFQTLFSVGCPG